MASLLRIIGQALINIGFKVKAGHHTVGMWSAVDEPNQIFAGYALHNEGSNCGLRRFQS